MDPGLVRWADRSWRALVVVVMVAAAAAAEDDDDVWEFLLVGRPAKMKRRKDPLKGISFSRGTILASRTRVTVAGGRMRPGIHLFPLGLKRADLVLEKEVDRLKIFGG